MLFCIVRKLGSFTILTDPNVVARHPATFRSSVLMTNEIHNYYNQFLFHSFLSALHVSNESSRSSSGYGMIYCISQYKRYSGAVYVLIFCSCTGSLSVLFIFAFSWYIVNFWNNFTTTAHIFLSWWCLCASQLQLLQLVQFVRPKTCSTY